MAISDAGVIIVQEFTTEKICRTIQIDDQIIGISHPAWAPPMCAITYSYPYSYLGVEVIFSRGRGR
jgi:hypothetical protein